MTKTMQIEKNSTATKTAAAAGAGAQDSTPAPAGTPPSSKTRRGRTKTAHVTVPVIYREWHRGGSGVKLVREVRGFENRSIIAYPDGSFGLVVGRTFFTKEA